MQEPIIDADAQYKIPTMKMVFHFSRVVDSDIHVEGKDFGDCVQKAIEERKKMCTPTKIQGEVE